MLRTQYKHSILLNATSDETSTSFHKPGGASLAILGNAVGTISQKYIDETGLGRWVYTILNAKNHRKIVVITAYRLCYNSLPRGHETAYSQQYRILRRQNVTNPRPKQLFDHDLISLLTQWRNKKYDIILMMDANTSILDHNLQKIIRSGQLYDLLAARNGINSPNTYIRGKQTIDFIFGTENVYNSVRHAGMLPFNHGIISDHRALWIDLHIPALFRGNLNDIYTRPPQLTTKNVKWTNQARKNITKKLRETSVRENLNQMMETLDKVSREFNIE